MTVAGVGMSVGLRAGLVRSLVAAGVAAQAGVALAQQADEQRERRAGDIVVTGEVGEEPPVSPLRATDPLDTPASVTVLSEEIIEQQGRTTLRDALRNITGISFQAGEGNPPGGGDAFSVRGFSAREDILVDGQRDIGNYFRDPFIAHRIDVTKGPASAFAGRGNVGGTVNILTFAPKLGTFGTVEATAGTANLFRGELDANIAIDEERGIALRVAAMGHSADEPGRDVTRNRRWAIAPTLVFGLDGTTVVRVNVLHAEQHNIPDFGIPNVRDLSFAGSDFFGQHAPVPRRNFYGYSTDYQDIVADTVTLRLDHDFGDGISLAHQSRIGRVHNDGIGSAPRWVAGTTEPDGNARLFGRGKPRDQVDRAWFNQTMLTVEFGDDAFNHSLVFGGEANFESAENRRRLDPDGPLLPLFDPPLIAGPIPAYNDTRARMETDTLSAYVFDTINIGDSFRIVGGLRFDDVRTRVQGFDDGGTVPSYVTDLSVSDGEWSGNVGLVWKPDPGTAIYFAYGTAFEPSGRSEVVQLAGVNNNPPVSRDSLMAGPERSEAWELGGRTDFPLFGGEAQLAGALFQITKSNARTPGIQPGDPAVVLDGEQRVRGLELQFDAEVHDRWTIFAGYSYLDGEVLRSNNPSEIGARLDNLPRHSASVWLSYRIAEPLMIGGGFQHVGSRRSNTIAPAGFTVVTVPAYTVADVFAEYDVSERVAVRLNVTNLFNAYYFQSFFNNHSIPSAGRAASLSVTVQM